MLELNSYAATGRLLQGRDRTVQLQFSTLQARCQAVDQPTQTAFDAHGCRPLRLPCWVAAQPLPLQLGQAGTLAVLLEQPQTQGTCQRLQTRIDRRPEPGGSQIEAVAITQRCHAVNAPADARAGL